MSAAAVPPDPRRSGYSFRTPSTLVGRLAAHVSDDENPISRDRARDDVRSVLRGIREPTADMIAAAFDNRPVTFAERERFLEQWRRAIDAAEWSW